MSTVNILESRQTVYRHVDRPFDSLPTLAYRQTDFPSAEKWAFEKFQVVDLKGKIQGKKPLAQEGNIASLCFVFFTGARAGRCVSPAGGPCL